MKRIIRVKAHLRKGRPVRAHYAFVDFMSGFRHAQKGTLLDVGPSSDKTEKEHEILSKAIRRAIQKKEGPKYRDYVRGYEFGEEYTG